LWLNKGSNDRSFEHTTASLGNIKRGNYVTGTLQGNFTPCSQLSKKKKKKKKKNGGKGKKVEQKKGANVSLETMAE
jgi:hypothetical protein